MTPTKTMEMGLYVVTNPELSLGRSSEEVAREAIAGGADVIQLRDKGALGRELYDIGMRLRELASREGVLFIVNDRLDIALAVEADGLHVGQEDLPAEVARRRLGPDKVLGVSVENGEQARRAAHDGANYVAIGPIYGTPTKTDAGPAIGPQAIAELRQHTELPIVAIGGIKRHHIAEVIGAGADGVAVISAIVGARDIAAAAGEMKRLIQEARG